LIGSISDLLSKSLESKILAITRNFFHAQDFSDLVKLEGGRTIALPTIEIVPKDPNVVQEFLNTVNEKMHDYCAFMSSQAVNVLFDHASRMNTTEQVISTLNSRTVVAVGPKTKQTLIERGVDVQIVPQTYSSKGLVELFAKGNIVKNKSIIIPRSEISNEFIVKALSDLGMTVDELFLYSVRTSKPNSNWNSFAQLLEQQKIDGIIFTSASAVRSFFEIAQKILPNTFNPLKEVPAIIAIGPFTKDELSKRDIQSFESKDHTIKGTFELAKVILGPR
jgi:uroporphyrinogen-III synthase